MKNFLYILFLLIPVQIFAQVASSEPALPVETDEVTVFFDVSKGSGTLSGYTGDVYVHTGVLTSKSTSGTDWKYVQTGWGENTPETKLTRIGTDLYQIVISPNIRDYYAVPQSEIITHMAFVLRSGEQVNGSYLECKEIGNKDIFVEVYETGLQVSIINPAKSTLALKNSDIVFQASSTESAELELFLNNNTIKTITGTELEHVFNFSESGDYWMKVTATMGEEIVADSVFVHILADETIDGLPTGSKEGFNETGPSSGILVLWAPGKEYVFILGDFNQFTPSGNYRMNRDGDYFWLELTGLSPGMEYAYQYLVDGEIKIADPYTQKVLDPWNDKYITETIYPGLKAYPSQYTDGIVSVLQTQKPVYQWSGLEFQSPPQENLMIYELLVRDFVANHDWKTLTDTLNYFSSLGINAIELMPVNEFEGNESWGYNPSFYFALDKYYGPANDFKEFIDSCHNRGIAVIIDMVFNHSYGQSPLVQLYWDNANGRPAADNPWYNVASPNPVYSWGYDFNHESQATKDFIDRANAFWLEEFKVDGFRYDFTKGFTNTPGDGGGYDASRISILKRMSDTIWSVKDDAYVILEHFADNSEEKVLTNYGMMIWGNHNYNYNEATMGFNDNGKSDFSWISYQNRTWTYPHLVGYMESHDEERLMFKNLEYGNSFGDYDVKDLYTALARVELAAAFFITIPGPKMIWQFEEMGYDYSIEYNGRVGNKEIRWDYYYSRPRIRELFSKLIDLKLNEPAFSTNDFNLSVRNADKRIELNHPDMDVRIVGNFDVKALEISPNFSNTGTWYDYLSGDSLEVTDVNMSVSLNAGQYRIYTTKKLATPDLPTKTIDYNTFEENYIYFPNPVSEMLHIAGEKKISCVKVYDVRGRLLATLDANQNSIEINLGSLENGLYFVKIFYGRDEIQTGRIIKQ